MFQNLLHQTGYDQEFNFEEIPIRNFPYYQLVKVIHHINMVLAPKIAPPIMQPDVQNVRTRGAELLNRLNYSEFQHAAVQLEAWF